MIANIIDIKKLFIYTNLYDLRYASIVIKFIKVRKRPASFCILIDKKRRRVHSKYCAETYPGCIRDERCHKF